MYGGSIPVVNPNGQSFSYFALVHYTARKFERFFNVSQHRDLIRFLLDLNGKATLKSFCVCRVKLWRRRICDERTSCLVCCLLWLRIPHFSN